MERKWLKMFATINDDIELLNIKIECLSISKSRYQINGDLFNNNDLEFCNKKIHEIDLEILKVENTLKQYKSQKNKMDNWLHRRKTLEANIINLYYKENMTLEQVADRLDYSVDRIKHIHADLVRKLK